MSKILQLWCVHSYPSCHVLLCVLFMFIHTRDWIVYKEEGGKSMFLTFLKAEKSKIKLLEKVHHGL